MDNRVEFWKLDHLPGAALAARALDEALKYALAALKSELAAGAGRFQAFRVAHGVLWWELARQIPYGAYDTVARENAWGVLFDETAPLLGYDDPEALCDDLCRWGRFYHR